MRDCRGSIAGDPSLRVATAVWMLSGIARSSLIVFELYLRNNEI
jgi:hypothetical protein